MNKIRGYIVGIILFMLVISSFVVYAKNTTLKTELFFWDGANQSLALSMTGVVPGNTYNFDVKVNNVWDVDAIVHMGFVDGTVTNDSYASKACLQEGSGEKLGQYISGPNDFLVNAMSSEVKTYTLTLPIGYNYSGNISACITHYPSATNDSGMFGMHARRANFLDVYVIPGNSSGDLVAPTIQSINPADGQSNIGNNTNIVITFSELMSGDIVEDSILLSPSIGSLSYSWSGKILTISHSSSFVYSTNYTLTINTGAQDLAGNHISSVYTSSFNVEADPGSGGGGGAHLHRDICVFGDNSSSYYDGICNNILDVENNENMHRYDHLSSNLCSVKESSYTKELDDAYIFACNLGITTMSNIGDADMTGLLLRKHLAKMISNFSINVLGNSPELNKKCEFVDMGLESKEMQYYAKMSCQLYLMGLHSDGITPKNIFDPNGIVTRAEFGTVLSRLLWSRKYASKTGELYFLRHLEALKSSSIMTKIYKDWPMKKEIRGWVMLMLMRANEKRLASKFNNNAILISQGGLIAMLDDGTPDVLIDSIGENPYHTYNDFVPIIGTLTDGNISKVRVTHSDSSGVGYYNNYYLKNFISGSKKFVFYAYRYYNSLTINDLNRYKFEFFDKNNVLVFVKTVWIDHNYVENR